MKRDGYSAALAETIDAFDHWLDEEADQYVAVCHDSDDRDVEVRVDREALIASVNKRG